MSKDYQDLQYLQNSPSDSQGFKMNLGFFQSSSRVQYAVHAIHCGLLVVIIILIVSFRPVSQEAQPVDRTLEYQLGNLSERLRSEVTQLSQDGNKLMERIQPMEKMLKDMQADPSLSTVQSAIQRVLVSISRLSDRIKKIELNGSQEVSCPTTWSKFQMSCYFFANARKSWSAAKAACEEKDSHMIVINTDEEQNFAFSMTKGKYTWIGLTDMTGDWKWVDGTRYDAALKNWIPGQPDDFYGHLLGGGEDCAHLHNIDNNGRWNDDHCSRNYNYLCEKDL